MRYLLLLPAVLLLAACASSPRDRVRPAPDGAYVVSVGPLEAQGEHRGWNRTIVLSDRLLAEETLARHVAAHELGHALGADHVPAPAIMAASHGPGEAPIEALTRREVRAASRGGPFAVRADESVPPRVYRALGWACDLWNRALGRQALTLLPHSLSPSRPPGGIDEPWWDVHRPGAPPTSCGAGKCE